MHALTVLLSLALYAVVHSLLAGTAVKRRLTRWLGERAVEGWYRIGYNVFAAITLLPIMTLVGLTPGAQVWQVEGTPRLLLLALQGTGYVGFLLALMQIDFWRFAGLRQVWAYLTGAPLPLAEELLQTHGVYTLVRHPLYLFSLLALWSLETMNEAMLAFNVGVTVYFVVGSLIEERRMLRVLGEPYAAYRRRVPWLIPGLRFSYPTRT